MSELIGMDFQSAMETFAEAWAAANAGAAAVAQVILNYYNTDNF